MSRLVVIAVALGLLSPLTASARTPPPVEGLTVQRVDCPGYETFEVVACADVENRVLYLPERGDRFAYLHEYGHVWEAATLTDADRAWATPVLGFRADAPWFRGEPGLHDPGEVFADAFATCHMPRLWPGRRVRGRDGAVRGGSIDAYGWQPTARQHRRICNAIAIWALVR